MKSMINSLHLTALIVSTLRNPRIPYYLKSIFQFIGHSYVYVVHLTMVIFSTVHHPHFCYTVHYSYSRMIYETFWEIYGRLLQVCCPIIYDFSIRWSETLRGRLLQVHIRANFVGGEFIMVVYRGGGL